VNKWSHLHGLKTQKENLVSSYKVISVVNVDQTEQDMSFKGGLPNIPERFEIPYCTQCSAELTFFFQIAFPKKHVWEGKVMAFFHCTSCYDVDNFWPKILYVRDHINISDHMLDKYQTNFRIFVFDASESVALQHKFKLKLKFESLAFQKINPKAKYDNTTKVGGRPAWDKSPLEGDDELYKEITYMGGGLEFLMQIERDWPYMRLPDAPLQFEHYKQYKDSPILSIYQPFMGPKIYFLGTTSPQVDPPRVLLYLM
jgi:hypothetical protein